MTTKLRALIDIVSVVLIGIVTILCGVSIFGKGLVASIGSIWAANALMLMAIFFGLQRRGRTPADLGLRIAQSNATTIAKIVLQSLPVFLAAILAFAVGAIFMANLVGMPEPADMSKYDYLRGNLSMTILALCSAYFISSFAEEVIYRGFLLNRLAVLGGSNRLATCGAVIVSALVFGAVHSDWGITGMVQASCMGLALGVSYLVVKRNLWVTILAHAYMDTILIVQMYLAGT